MKKADFTFLPRQSDEDVSIQHEQYDEDELKSLIRKLNLKVTAQRLLILKSLCEGRRHITAQELFERVVKADPSIGFATVYRFLRHMNEQKFVTEVRLGGLPARYELAPKRHHDHLTCTACGQIVEFENKTIETLQEKVARQFGYTLDHHVLELYGICPQCQASKKAKT
jgi:Fur family ferric uptake transcriptional regulator